MSNIKPPVPRVLQKTAKAPCLCRLQLCLPMLYALSMTFQYIMFSVMLAQE
jgi:hypothetical protein